MALTAAMAAGRYQVRRPLKKSDINPVPHRWRYVLELHLAGTKVAEISELTGYAPPTIYRILNEDDIVILKQQIMRHYDSEFETLFPEVIRAIKNGLADPEKYLEAAKVWLKAHGKLDSNRDLNARQTINVTAEDVVFQILNGGVQQGELE